MSDLSAQATAGPSPCNAWDCHQLGRNEVIVVIAGMGGLVRTCMSSTKLLGTGTPMRFLVVAAGSVIDVIVDSIALLECIIAAAVQNSISMFVPSIISAQFTVALVIVVGPVVSHGPFLPGQDA